jgi:type VI secretion system protein ImpE
MNAGDLFHSGNLQDAVQAALSDVKSKPTDGSLRWLLCELFCFNGDLERADKQLELLVKQDPKSTPILALFRQLIRAETARREFYTAGRVPEFFQTPDEAVNLQLKSAVFLRDGDLGQAADLAAQAEDIRPVVSGRSGEEAFDDLRDLDDSLSTVFEVCTPTGKYFWVPTNKIRSIEFHPPEHPRDLLWRQVTMDVVDGPNGEAYIPCMYHGSHESEHDSLRLGRATEWNDRSDGLVNGLGQRTFLVGDADVGVLEFTQLTFDIAETESTSEPEPAAAD